MNILLNRNANSGKSHKAIDKALLTSPLNKYNSIFSENSDVTTQKINHWCRDQLNNKSYNFTAIGGDGTLNLLLNDLMKLSFEYPETNNKIVLGSVGVGSSNDAHKPFKTNKRPYLRTNTNNAEKIDIGQVEFLQNGALIKKYFLLNSSIGITSNANALFNSNNSLVGFVKKISTDLAIYYVALVGLIKNKKLFLDVTINNETKPLLINNMSILKRSYFGGSFHYKYPPKLDDGLYKVLISSDLGHFKLLKTAFNLLLGRFNKSKNNSILETSKVMVKSNDGAFNIEIDGEVFSTTEATWTLNPKYLKVIL